jgi:hypothetical protein
MWCGMCFTPLEPETAPTVETERSSDGLTESRTAAVADVTIKVPMWPCPICDGRNAMDLDQCATCGTPFAALMRDDRVQPKVEPNAAFRRSLLFPGLGHRLVGRTLDGLARGVLFGMLLIATLVLGLSGVTSGPVRGLFLLYAAASVGVYVITALESSRLARGGEPMVSSRILLWAAVAILLLSVLVVSFAVGTSARR